MFNSNNQRLPYGSIIPTLEELDQYDHEQTIALLKYQVQLGDDSISLAILKPKQADDEYYPLNALKGIHLVSAIQSYNDMYKEKNSIKAKQQMITSLMRNNKISDEDVASKVARWLVTNYIEPSSSEKKRKDSPNGHGNPKRQKVETFTMNHQDVLNVLISEIPLNEKEVETIQKQIDENGQYPMNALCGKHLNLAIDYYESSRKSGKSINESNQAMIEYLMEDTKVSEKHVAILIIQWLTDNFTTKIQDLFINYSARTKKSLLVTNEALFYEYLFDDNFVEQVNEAFDKLLSAGDLHVEIPFMACAPGSGKSRTLQEIFSKTKIGKKFKENSIEILISFGNGTPITSETDFEKALIDRVLYSYLNIMVSYNEFLKELQNIEKYNFEQVINCIGEHWRTSNSVSDDLYIYLGIDEFTNLGRFAFLNEMGEKRTFLDGVINIIGKSVLLKGNVRILPFFAGLDCKLFEHSIAKSKFSCFYITPYRFTHEDEQLIVKRHFSILYYSKDLWKSLYYCNKHPRLIAWLIHDFEIHKNIKQAYQMTEKRYKSTYLLYDIPEIVAKWILSHVITQQPITDKHVKVIEDKTAKNLEENGWIYLHDKKGKEITISAPLPVLYACTSKLEDSNDMASFQKFLRLLEEASWEQKTHSKYFAKFNASFDCVLNICFMYLQYSEMSILQRFRGIQFGSEITNNTDTIISLASCPRNYIEAPISFQGAESTPNSIKEGIMIVNQLEECFFDRFMKVDTNDRNKTNTHVTILWQDRGMKTDMMPNFQQQELKDIVNKHFRELM